MKSEKTLYIQGCLILVTTLFGPNKGTHLRWKTRENNVPFTSRKCSKFDTMYID